MKPILTADRLSIRHLQEDDAQKLLAMSQEQSLREWLPDQVYRDIAHSREVLNYLLESLNSEGPHKAPFVYGICLEKELIGHIGLSPWRGSLEIGFAIEESQQGNGFARESLLHFCPWAFKSFHLPELYAVVAIDNQSSCNSLSKAGFQPVEEKIVNYHGRKERVQIMRILPE